MLTWENRNDATSVEEAMEALADFPRNEDRAETMIFGSVGDAFFLQGRVYEYAGRWGIPINDKALMQAGAEYLNENSEWWGEGQECTYNSGAYEGRGWFASYC